MLSKELNRYKTCRENKRFSKKWTLLKQTLWVVRVDDLDRKEARVGQELQLKL
jgi:hypothetical protein